MLDKDIFLDPDNLEDCFNIFAKDDQNSENKDKVITFEKFKQELNNFYFKDKPDQYFTNIFKDADKNNKGFINF